MKPAYDPSFRPSQELVNTCSAFYQHREGAALNLSRWRKTISAHRLEQVSTAGKLSFFMASLHDVQHCNRYTFDRAENLLFWEARGFAQKQAISDSVKRAPVWGGEDLRRLRDRLPEKMRALVDFMMVVPIRISCLKFLTRECVSVRGDFLTVVVPGGKTIATQQHIVPRRFKLSEFLPGTIKFILSGRAAKTVIFDIDVHEFNQILRLYADGFHITSYSTRYFAINRQIDETRDSRGVPDYEKAKLSTGHRNTKSISGSYELP